MSQLRVRPRRARGLVTEVTPESAGWTYVGFALHRLRVGESVAAETGTREVCLALVAGKARLTIDGRDFGEIGGRMSPFDGAPWAAYAPAGSRYTLTATTALELGVTADEVIRALVKAHSIRPERYTILGGSGLTRDAAERLAKVTGVID